MKVLRVIGSILKALILLAFLVTVLVFTSSYGWKMQKSALRLFGEEQIEFTSGMFPKESTTELVTTLQSGETALLDGFASLSYADFSGSTNYEEIVSWAQAHPDVTVVYTVALPNGKTAANTATTADLTGLKHEEVGEAINLLRYLPSVSTVELGTSGESASPINAEDLAALENARADITVHYLVDLLGNALPMNTEAVDLSELTSAQVPQTAASLAMLPHVSAIKIADNATTDGSLTWDDLTAISRAAPAAALDYHFTVGGVSATTGDESLDLSALGPEEVSSVLSVLPAMTQLKSIDLGSEGNGLSLDDITAIGNAAPDASLSYTFTLYGRQINLSDTYLDFNHITITDEGAAVRRVLPYMKNVVGLDMDSCGVSDEAMAAIRDENPNVSVVWRVWFGRDYSVRTDVVKILASKPSKGGPITNDNSRGLQYCTKVRYIDLGHNDDLTDFSFIRNMPDLQIAVISITGISDLSPFSECRELLYLEMGNTRVSDVSPLASCTKLRHLNIGTNPGISDISSLYDLPLLRLWIGVADPVPSEQIEQFRQLHPDCEINTTAPSGNERDANGNVVNEGFVQGNWKIYQRYLTYDWNIYAKYSYFPDQRPLGYFKVVYLAFEYNLKENAYAFTWNDPMYNAHGDDVQPVNMKIVDVSLLSEEWHDHDILTPIYPDDESYG